MYCGCCSYYYVTYATDNILNVIITENQKYYYRK